MAPRRRRPGPDGRRPRRMTREQRAMWDRCVDDALLYGPTIAGRPVGSSGRPDDRLLRAEWPRRSDRLMARAERDALPFKPWAHDVFDRGAPLRPDGLPDLAAVTAVPDPKENPDED